MVLVAHRMLRFPLWIALLQCCLNVASQQSPDVARTDSINGSGGKETIHGDLRKWHKVTLAFHGIATSEQNTTLNPFTDLRLDVTFHHTSSNTTYVVPGFYACDGNAAETGATAGDVWLAILRPDHTGTWTYTAQYTMGPNVATAALPLEDTSTSALFMDGAVGSFTILGPAKSTTAQGLAPRDLRAKGRLEYVGEHHLKFRDGGFFLKAGSDSPENFLAYEGFGTLYCGGCWHVDTDCSLLHNHRQYSQHWQPKKDMGAPRS